MTSHETPTIDIDGIPDVDGRPFVEVLSEHFDELTDHEAEHGPYSPLKEPTTQQLLEWANLEGRNFARERGVWVGRDSDENGPYLIVHTRNGAGNREHVDYDEDGIEAGPACDCVGCIQTYRIPSYPGYVHDEDDEFDPTYANNYFALPKVPQGFATPGSTVSRLNDLHALRQRMADGEVMPTVILPRREDHAVVLNDYGKPYTSPSAWWANRSDTAAGAITFKTKQIADYQSQLDGLRAAYAEAEPVTERPEPRTRRRTGRTGRPLKSTEPVPVPRFDTAYAAWKKDRTDNIEREQVTSDFERLSQDETLAEATRRELAKDAGIRRKVDADFASRRALTSTNLEYAMKMSWFAAPAEMERLEMAIETTRSRVAQIETDLERSRDHGWLCWPGDDYDAYLAWRAAHMAQPAA